MNNVDEFNGLKELLTASLQSFEIDNVLINQLLTDNFINGLLQIKQREPENNEFVILMQNFSDTQNLNTLQQTQEIVLNELSKDGYVRDVLTYIRNSWENIIFPDEEMKRSVAAGAQRVGAVIGSGLTTIANSVATKAYIFFDDAFGWYRTLSWVHDKQNQYYDIIEGKINADEIALRGGIGSIITTAEETRSPLVIDLDGDGVETTTTKDGVYFDHDGNGFIEKSAWVGQGDGLLVRDINNNGEIENGTELFGNNSVLSSGVKALNGFEALKDLDSNGDGIFNNADAAWNEVKVWKDSNQNGKVDSGELLTLEQANISGINLSYHYSNNTDANGNEHRQQGSFIKTDGTTGSIHDVWFETDGMDSLDTADVTIPEDIKALPNIGGFGNVHDLQTAMALDESGALKALVEQYIAETNLAARKTLLLDIIYHWAGVQDMDPDGRQTSAYGNVLGDARKLEALEEFMGKEYLGTWCWGERDPNPHGKAAPYILRAFDLLFNYVNNELLTQTHCKSLLEGISLTWNAATQNWDINVSSAVSQLQAIYNQDAAAGLGALRELESIVENIDFAGRQDIYNAFRAVGNAEGNSFEQSLAKFAQLYGTDGNDEIFGTSGAEEIDALGGNDKIYSGGGNDTVNGGSGDDVIWGEDGNDTLIGGAGNDTLVGGNGDDIYLFNPGFGNDVLDNSATDSDGANNDTIQFGEGILPGKVTLERQDYDLIIKVSYAPDETGVTPPQDSIRVYSYFDKQGTTSATVNKIVFADGTEWGYNYVRDHYNLIAGAGGGMTVEGGEGKDTLRGHDKDDVLIGNAGNDDIDGGFGNNIIIGGTGNDNLGAGTGNDAYIWNWGDGMDTVYDSGGRDKIVFGPGIYPTDLTFRQVSGTPDLQIIIKGDDSQGIIIRDFHHSNTSFQIEDLYFDNGEILYLSDMVLSFQQSDKDETVNFYNSNSNISAVYGNGGNDTIIGNMEDNIIVGGRGNDILDGGSGGNDTFIYNLGDGFDTISDFSSSGEQDKIKFGEGISLSDVTFRREGDDLIITLFNDCAQGMVVKNFFYGTYYKIESLEFADGTIFSLVDNTLELHQTDKNDTIQGTDNPDIIFGHGGDDRIDGYGDNDIIIGGTGNDTLIGDSGDDTYIYNLGDGFDTISDNSGNNKIQFGEGIGFSNLTMRRVGENLHIYINNDRNQGMVLQSFFYSNNYNQYTLMFADGTSRNLAQEILTLSQTEGDENISGTSKADIIFGNGGNDTISAGDGDNIIVGGKGNDTLTGGWNNDTYVWNLGDGFDTITDGAGQNIIQFGEGISYDDLTMQRVGDELWVYVNGDQNQGFKLKSFFFNNNFNQYTFSFADGTNVNMATKGLELFIDGKDTDIAATGYDDIIHGSAGNDTINGSDGNDIIIGGKGDDTLNGSWDNDTYIWNRGDGFDSISDGAGQNVIQFGEGISYDDLVMRNISGHLHIYVNGDRGQGMVLNGFFVGSNNNKYTLSFANGTSVNLWESGMNYAYPDSDDEINGTQYNDTLIGNSGNDRIDGSYGNDTIIGGKGNDTLIDGAGNETYVWNLGDGFDYISDTSGEDKIVFGENISAENLSFIRQDSNLLIVVNGDYSQGMKINGFFQNDSYKIETIRFHDGSSINLKEMEFNFTDSPDQTITGTDDDETLSGGIGNDIINSGDGYNDITGGKGNDTITGGCENDTYYYNLGDGVDTINDPRGRDQIVFGAGITSADITYTKTNNDLRITVQGDANQGIIIKEFFASDNNKIESVKFANGAVQNLAKTGLILTQTNADDNITGTSFSDTICGNGGNDTLIGGDGNDILVGGVGNDRLEGGLGDDTYIYNLGDGFDTIVENSGQNKILFGTGITKEDLAFKRDGDHLIITLFNDIYQGMKVADFFSSFENGAGIDVIEFADGSSLRIKDSGFTFEMTDVDETINGTAHNDVIKGNGGNDSIIAGTGNDTLIGGLGNDRLEGGNGDDSYIYNLGDGFDTVSDSQGQDKIVFGAGIALSDIRFSREGNNLRLIINNNASQGILIDNQFSAEKQIEQLVFADGSSFSLIDSGFAFEQYDYDETINGTEYDDTINGKAGNDAINAGDGDDVLIGGLGNDTLNGGYGRDTYIYNLGDGRDVINEEYGKDTIIFGENISQADLSFIRTGYNLTIIVKNNSEQSITINNFFKDSSYQVEKLKFADGSAFNLSTEGLVLKQSNADDNVSGTIYNDVIFGNGGHDTINSGDGNDTLIGGLGNDTLNGGLGDNAYIYNLGDGFDIINETGGSDKIVFGSGISQEDLSFAKVGNNLRITVNGDDKGIEINNHFNSDDNKVESIEFHDGHTLDISNADQLVQAMNGFSISNSASTDVLSDATQNVSEMYNLAANSDLSRKAG